MTDEELLRFFQQTAKEIFPKPVDFDLMNLDDVKVGPPPYATQPLPT